MLGAVGGGRQLSEPEQSPSPPARGPAVFQGTFSPPHLAHPAFSSWLQASPSSGACSYSTAYLFILLIYSFICPHHSILTELRLHSRPLLDAGDPVITRYTVPALCGVHSLGEIEGKRLVTSIPKICFHLVINGEKQISCLPQEAPPTETFPLGNHLLGCELWREELHLGPVPHPPRAWHTGTQ